MKWVYLRWGAVSLAGVVIFVLCVVRYERNLKTITPKELLQSQTEQTVRVRGMVSAGTLRFEGSSGAARFQIEEDGQRLPVEYHGEAPENLRELKTLVFIGRLNRSKTMFKAEKIALIPNFGFVSAAYFVGLVPMVLFLFRMEWRVVLLYNEIRDLKIYEPEVEQIDAR